MPYPKRKSSSKLRKKVNTLTPKTVKQSERALVVQLAKTQSRVSKIAKLTSVAVRYSDTPFSTGVSTVGVFQLINGLFIGDTDGTRDGTIVEIKSIHIRGAVTVGDAFNNVRIILLQDKQPNTGAPSVTTVLSTGGDPSANPNWLNRSRYKFLADRNVVLSNTGNQIARWSMHVYKKIVVKYNNTNNGDITDILKNSIYLLMISDSGAVPNPTVYGNIRMVFQP